ncbi:tagaturonate reductase [Rhizobium sp. PP-CC-2G-626]|nr:tagaturonate reductase [Rhizobium sp. PP-CC-2G-626]
MTAILQFGTSRFLLAHADLFVSQALETGQAIGRITVVQTTDSPESASRIAALTTLDGYPVQVRGLRAGVPVREDLDGRAIERGLSASRDWAVILDIAAKADVILSNTGDRGYDLSDEDTAERMAQPDRVPRSFPAKLAALLLGRWRRNPHAPLSIFPCELVQRNGDRLRALVLGLAAEWSFPPDFIAYLKEKCHFANSLVDRIVSEPLHPIGAVAEPYALWAIQRQEGLVLPCVHPSIVLTDALEAFEDLKLFFLNLGHTVLADAWLTGGRPKSETVREIMEDADIRARLEAIWRSEVLPVFAAASMAAEAERYIEEVRDRFMNPFLDHRLSDIAGNHAEKKRRRLQPVRYRGRALPHPLAQPLLSAILESDDHD